MASSEFPPESIRAIVTEVANLLKERKETITVAETVRLVHQISHLSFLSEVASIICSSYPVARTYSTYALSVPSAWTSLLLLSPKAYPLLSCLYYKFCFFCFFIYFSQILGKAYPLRPIVLSSMSPPRIPLRDQICLLLLPSAYPLHGYFCFKFLHYALFAHSQHLSTKRAPQRGHFHFIYHRKRTPHGPSSD
jgi:hypothetical protein